jgi:EmrB/QacA subfamily drug resistance transporter
MPANKSFIAILVSFALFMDTLDTSIINTAIPAMAQSLRVNPVDLKIALISYLLSLATFIPTSGYIADKFGTKRVFIAALFIFTLSSFWCGYANTLWELVIARCIQGLGGSLMLPTGRLILLRIYPRHEVQEAMNTVVMIVSLGLMLGPVAGGIITQHISWHWIFWMNIPMGIAAIVLSWYFLPEIRIGNKRAFDWLGFFLFGGGLALLTFSLADISESENSPTLVFYLLFISCLMLGSYFLHSYRKKKHALLNPQLFKHRTFRVSILANLFGRLGFGGMPFLLPLLFQVSLGFTPQSSGLLVAPVALGVFLVKLKYMSTNLLRLWGYKRLLLVNSVLVGVSIMLFQWVTVEVSIYVILFLTLLYGFLNSLQNTGMNSLAYADVNEEDLSTATSLVSTVQLVAQSFGVALAALFLRYYANPGFVLVESSFQKTFLAMGLITMSSTFIFLHLSKTDGHQMLRKKVPKNLPS